ncbi:MAG: hypothetical protein GWP44_12845 [Proteobacteria bacterium]|nr:hypothetical protein [Pseudomonadota bacterium]
MILEERDQTAFHSLAARLEVLFGRGPDQAWTDEEFAALALEVFEVQFTSNVVYRGFCEGRGVTSASVDDWREIPAVPTRAFKHLDLLSASPAEATFQTSGTTSDLGLRGRHLIPRVSLYEASLLPCFSAHLMPEGKSLRFISLIPDPEDARGSSLSYMVGAAARRFASRTDYVVDGSGVVDHGVLAAALADAQAAAEAVLMLGTAFAFMNVMEHSDVCLGPLPQGSRIMETGGFKGRGRAVPRDELYEAMSRATSVPVERIVNEYGMTELLSQLYEPVLTGESLGCGHIAPPWLQVRAVDPTTLRELPEGEAGLLTFFDLANAGSVAHILTEDFGAVRDGRVFLEGRAAGAEPRGCSRAMDELMAVAR